MRLMVLGQALIQHDLREHPWADFAMLAAMFADADFCFTNLETAIRSSLAEPPTREGVFLHAADPAVLDCLKDLSITLLATASNHAWDLGAGGIAGALIELERRGFAHAGIGANLTAAAAPSYRRTASGTVAMVAAASGAIRHGAAASAVRTGVNELRPAPTGGLDHADAARMFAMIAEAAARADIVLAYHHNHILEEAGRRTPHWLRRFARQCIDAGASIYVSHGAPRLHGIELYRQRPIFYGLGNLIFQTATEEGFYDEAVWHSAIAECRYIGGRFCEMLLTPIRLNPRGIRGSGDLATRGRPSIASGAQAGTILGRLAELCRPFGTRVEVADETAIIRAS